MRYLGFTVGAIAAAYALAEPERPAPQHPKANRKQRRAIAKARRKAASDAIARARQAQQHPKEPT